MIEAAALSSGSLLLPHLGLWIQEGQPVSQGHSSTVRSVASHNSGSNSKPFSEMPTPPGNPSYEEDLRPPGLSVVWSGEAANVLPVAHGEQRQDAYCRVLHSAQAALEVEPLTADALLSRRRHVKPEWRGDVPSGRQVQVLLIQHYIREELLPPEPNYLFRYFDLAIAGKRLAQSLLTRAADYG